MTVNRVHHLPHRIPQLSPSPRLHHLDLPQAEHWNPSQQLLLNRGSEPQPLPVNTPSTAPFRGLGFCMKGAWFRTCAKPHLKPLTTKSQHGLVRSRFFVVFRAPQQCGEAGNMAAPISCFPTRCAMLEECPSRTEDEEASKVTEPSRGAVSQVAGSKAEDVSLSGLSGGRVFQSVLCESV